MKKTIPWDQFVPEEDMRGWNTWRRVWLPPKGAEIDLGKGPYRGPSWRQIRKEFERAIGPIPEEGVKQDGWLPSRERRINDYAIAGPDGRCFFRSPSLQLTAFVFLMSENGAKVRYPPHGEFGPIRKGPDWRGIDLVGVASMIREDAPLHHPPTWRKRTPWHPKWTPRGDVAVIWSGTQEHPIAWSTDANIVGMITDYVAADGKDDVVSELIYQKTGKPLQYHPKAIRRKKTEDDAPEDENEPTRGKKRKKGPSGVIDVDPIRLEVIREMVRSHNRNA